MNKNTFMRGFLLIISLICLLIPQFISSGISDYWLPLIPLTYAILFTLFKYIDKKSSLFNIIYLVFLIPSLIYLIILLNSFIQVGIMNYKFVDFSDNSIFQSFYIQYFIFYYLIQAFIKDSKYSKINNILCYITSFVIMLLTFKYFYITNNFNLIKDSAYNYIFVQDYNYIMILLTIIAIHNIFNKQKKDNFN